ncbi:unnamed protein product [Closterium sp. Naga37s-1]|nr:unnamed protein product [Closterium sp. Naga37s-1]
MEVLNGPAVQASGVPISWTLYFPSEEFSPEDRRAELIKSLIDGFLTEKGQQLLQQADPKELSLFSRWTVSMESLKQHLQPACSAGQSDLGAAAELLLQALEAAPEEALACLGAAATEMFLERGLIEAPALPSASACASQHASSRLAVRLVDHTDSVIEFKKLKASSLDRLVTVCGTVVRVGPLRPLVVAMDFTCTRCGAITSLSFPDGRFTQPTACGHDNCRNRTFLQNRAGGTGGGEDMGRMPRVVDCELREDLADACLPGDVVAVCGIVKIINNETDVGGVTTPSAAATTAATATPALRSPPSAGGASGGAVELGEEDLRGILEYVVEHEGEGDLFQHIVHSFCPSIYGHVLVKGAITCLLFALRRVLLLVRVEGRWKAGGGGHEEEGDLLQHIVHSFCHSVYGHAQVKWHLQLLPSSSLLPSPLSLSLAAGIILSLFGGVRKHEGDANRVPVRGDVHALLVGDPGMGKSQLLKAAAAVAPRGVYVCGSGASSVGLTVAVVKDGPGGEYAFEAVAVVKDGPGGEYAFEAGWWWEGKKGEREGMGAAVPVAPRGVYVCGSGASSVGLTVAVVKDGPGGEYAFEAGAMVMADQGTCCIDEFDKMGNEQQVGELWVACYGELYLALSFPLPRPAPSPRRYWRPWSSRAWVWPRQVSHLHPRHLYFALSHLALSLPCFPLFQALLEAMEQQSVGVAKAGLTSAPSSSLLCSFPPRPLAPLLPPLPGAIGGHGAAERGCGQGRSHICTLVISTLLFPTSPSRSPASPSSRRYWRPWSSRAWVWPRQVSHLHPRHLYFALSHLALSLPCFPLFQALLEAMEQQSVGVAKAGLTSAPSSSLLCSFPPRPLAPLLPPLPGAIGGHGAAERGCGQGRSHICTLVISTLLFPTSPSRSPASPSSRRYWRPWSSRAWVWPRQVSHLHPRHLYFALSHLALSLPCFPLFQALLEAMEQQSVSVAKAGLLANFSARTAVLAAANPVGGHYNRARTLNENLKLSAALLSRFDLIFILLDRPDHHTDQRLSEHVLQMHAGMPSRSKASKRCSHLFLTAPSATDGHASHLDLPLSHRLRLRSSAARNFSPLSPARLRQYIAYARTHVHPRLSEEARAVIKAFYLRLREHSRAMDGPPITARQLESLVRLAEARARVELREEVTEADAQEAVELMGECLLDKLTDEAGNIDAGRGGSSSKSKESKRFLAALQRTAKQAIKTCFSRKELAQLADDMCLRVPDLDALIDSLNEAGFLLKKGGGLFQVRVTLITLESAH